MMMVLGASAYAYVVGVICGILANMDPGLSDYHSAMDNLNNYMDDIKIPDQLRLELRLYFQKCKDVHKRKYYKESIRLMSPGLQRRFVQYTYAGPFPDFRQIGAHTVCFSARPCSRARSR